jgi:hypothetical protein
MKRFSTLLLAGSALLLALVPNIRAEEPTPEVLIGRVRAVTLSPHFSREEITQALIDTLDAALQVLPQADYAAEFKSHVGTVREMLTEGALFEGKVRQYLELSYKLVSGGQAWVIPDELASAYKGAEIMDRAKKICAALLDASLAELKAGRRDAAVRDLVSFVIFVITPVEA